MAPADPAREGDPAEPIEVTVDEAALYAVVRKAVEDAVLGVIGTLLLLGVALVLIWMGAVMALGSDARSGVVSVLVGAALAVVGLYVAAATLDVIPPIREWL